MYYDNNVESCSLDVNIFTHQHNCVPIKTNCFNFMENFVESV